ncbi:hypothetical protein ACFU76_14900 [Streptomyces sp. NPDC057539]|uniref:hypothetical protein n=1 Tax=Streptomyces sp. NPDC057539 TaxID=3346159 RepID=UPI00367F23C0
MRALRILPPDAAPTCPAPAAPTTLAKTRATASPGSRATPAAHQAVAPVRTIGLAIATAVERQSRALHAPSPTT